MRSKRSMNWTLISIILDSSQIFPRRQIQRTISIQTSSRLTSELKAIANKMCRVCAASSSSSYSSSDVDGNETVRASGDAARQAYCQGCFNRMERAVRKHYEQLVQQTTDEGLSMCWPYGELIKARERLRKAEHKELMTLREMSGM